jgi:hypothetical protein
MATMLSDKQVSNTGRLIKAGFTQAARTSDTFRDPFIPDLCAYRIPMATRSSSADEAHDVPHP